MKTLAATAFLSGILVSVAFAQGTVNFQNIVCNALNAPDYLSDGTTKLAGPQFMAELLGGPTATSLSLIATTPFLTTNNGAGYYLGGVQTINTVPPGGDAFIQVNVWNTATGMTFNQARVSGLANAWAQSSVFTVTTGNPTIPGLPATLLGLTPLSLNAAVPIPLLFTTTPGTSPVYLNGVPEPSTLALVGFAAALVLLRWR
jgi:PEP-CTERM motif